MGLARGMGRQSKHVHAHYSCQWRFQILLYRMLIVHQHAAPKILDVQE